VIIVDELIAYETSKNSRLSQWLADVIF